MTVSAGPTAPKRAKAKGTATGQAIEMPGLGLCQNPLQAGRSLLKQRPRVEDDADDDRTLSQMDETFLGKHVNASLGLPRVQPDDARPEDLEPDKAASATPQERKDDDDDVPDGKDSALAAAAASVAPSVVDEDVQHCSQSAPRLAQRLTTKK